MTLRITSQPLGESATALRLEGRFSTADLAVFDSCVEQLAGCELRLDLAELRWLDPPAIERVRGLIRAGARVVATSPFVDKLLARGERDAPPARESAGSAADPCPTPVSRPSDAGPGSGG